MGLLSALPKAFAKADATAIMPLDFARLPFAALFGYILFREVSDAWTWAGAAFAFFTTANLLPRALAHHRWYHEKFPDYPRERKAIVPGLL